MRSLEDGRHVILMGESGIGKTHVLNTLATQWSASGRPALRLSCRAGREAIRIAESTPTEAALFIDDFEYIEPELLAALAERFSEGGVSVSAVQNGHATNQLAESVSEVMQDIPALLADWDRWLHLRLDPMTDAEIERLVHERSEHLVDSVTMSMIVQLARGRPGWATDLLMLAEHGLLVDDLRSTIDTRGLRELHLVSLREAALNVGPLPEQAAAAAVVLSELDPLDQTQAGDLTDSQSVHELLSRGVIVLDEATQLLSVPPFLAAAVRTQAPPVMLDHARQSAAERLLLQETLGIPLSSADSLFCARFAASGSFSDAPGAASALRAVLRRTTEELVAFGREGSARALLLRSAGLGMQLDGAFGARAMSVIGGPKHGLVKLPSPSAEAAEVPRPERLASVFLRSILESESGLATLRSASDDEEAGEDATVLRLFRLWNATGSIADEMPFIRQVARDDRAPDLQLIAAALFKFELLWNGHQPAPADYTRFLHLLERAGFTEEADSRDLIDTAVVSYAMTLLLSDNYRSRAEELTSLVNSLPRADLHRRWLTHLLATATAVTAGHAERSLMEWSGFEQRTPRFLPRRLRERISAVTRILEQATAYAQKSPKERRWTAATERSSARETRWNLHHLFAYLLGQTERLPQLDTPPDEQKHLRILALMHEHTTASAQQNPAALQRVAHKLTEASLPGPALTALRETRAILVKRRASGAATRCDRQIAEVRVQMLREVPWLRDEDLPQGSAASLTPREVEAARLAARGLSNLEISRRLDCSIRTVESHLSQARAKLGLASRQDLRLHPGLAS
ncbi:hypothetical protein GCM10009847_12990 [Leucobacter tardus]